ncbi:hypothetical protein HPB50_010731 [Hyalomma asiaticum]|uniref:Uncharacterized protein n=1 Tax=Hyalomma asiaticum TaxID=266040 RepID=A0ACB7RIK3_HYAAI|nr:hypothetical protein HPB50_010731 [Hyalomma asiaticum]
MKRDSGGNGTSTDGERNVYELACSQACTLRTQRNQLRRRSKQLKQLWWQWRWHPLMAAQAVPSSVCVPLLIDTGCTGGPSASAGRSFGFGFSKTPVPRVPPSVTASSA